MSDHAELMHRIQVANTINEQIPRWLKMAVGYKNPRALKDETPGLVFDCRGRGSYTVHVEYDEGADLYNVRVFTHRTPPREFYTALGADVEEMVSIIDQIDRGRISAS